MACSKKYRYRWNTKHAVLELLYDSELYNLPGYYGGRFVNHFINNYFGFEGYNGIHLDLVMDNESFTYDFFEPMLFVETEWVKRIGGKKYYLHLGYRKDGSRDSGDDKVIFRNLEVQ